MQQHGIEAEGKVEKENQKKKKKQAIKVFKKLKVLSINDNTVWSFLIKVETLTYQ